MKSFLPLFLALLCLAVAACSAAQPDSAAAKTAIAAAKGPIRETFKTADQFDPADLAAIRKLRDEWMAAFATGNPAPVEFMFTNDALFTLPPDPSLTGDNAPSARQLFERFAAQLVFDEKSEQFVTDGGDPRKMTKLPWVSYYSAYKLTLASRDGGDRLETNGRFMTRFRRQTDGSLKVMRGFNVGQRTADFTLSLMKGDGLVQLSRLEGKPTVLIFGSYT